MSNTRFNVIQDHHFRYQCKVRMQLPICDSNLLSCTVCVLWSIAMHVLQVIQQELMNMQQKCHEQNVSERRLFEKMLGADKQNLAATTVHKAATASVIINIFMRYPHSSRN